MTTLIEPRGRWRALATTDRRPIMTWLWRWQYVITALAALTVAAVAWRFL